MTYKIIVTLFVIIGFIVAKALDGKYVIVLNEEDGVDKDE